MSFTNKDASVVLAMSARGDKKHDIAAWFGENQARIAEIEQGSHGIIALAPASDLPPRGAPGPKGRKLRSVVLKALDAMEKGDAEAAKKLLGDGVTNYNRNET